MLAHHSGVGTKNYTPTRSAQMTRGYVATIKPGLDAMAMLRDATFGPLGCHQHPRSGR